MFTLRRKSLAAWIALAAVLYAAATPVFAALRYQSQPDILGAICTLGGVKEAPGNPAVPAEGGAIHQQHCVFCISGAWQPPADVSLSVPVPSAPEVAVLTGRVDVHLHDFSTLQPLSPRAPPRLV